ncbi:MAG: hypothetical protein H3C51_08430 [Rubellimicrobium sp.]|nr:hypothetical protein [Rubellimicrobium sp.]
MIWRLSGALLRALLMAALVVTPALILSGPGEDTGQFVILIALMAGVLTFLEYRAAWPVVVEFRDAPPFNRIRFVALFATVTALALIFRGDETPSTLTRLLVFVGTRVSGFLDFPYSPVRLVAITLTDMVDPRTLEQARVAAGLSYLVSILMLVALAGAMWRRGWPLTREGFNVWVNLPVFDPAAGGDLVRRVDRDAQVNLILGFLLPFIIPAVVRMVAGAVDFALLASPQALIWVVAAWAFLPASLLMRGMALMRLAHLIAAQRRREAGDGALGHV